MMLKTMLSATNISSNRHGLAHALKACLTAIQVSHVPPVFATVFFCANDTMIIVSTIQDCKAAQQTLD